jgi:hypothetical protein
LETEASKNYNNITEDQRDRMTYYPERSGVENINNNTFPVKHIPGISDDFSYYLHKLSLAGDPNMIVLSSSNHYYYEAEDLKNVKTLVNAKQLNHINQVREFLDNIFSILPSKSYLTGCFSDNKDQIRFLSDSHKPDRKIAGQFDPAENGITSRNPFLNMVYNILDIKTNRYLTKKAVTRELEISGWRVVDMTEIKGLTYFCAQKNLVN